MTRVSGTGRSCLPAIFDQIGFDGTRRDQHQIGDGKEPVRVLAKVATYRWEEEVRIEQRDDVVAQPDHTTPVLAFDHFEELRIRRAPVGSRQQQASPGLGSNFCSAMR